MSKHISKHIFLTKLMGPQNKYNYNIVISFKTTLIPIVYIYCIVIDCGFYKLLYFIQLIISI